MPLLTTSAAATPFAGSSEGVVPAILVSPLPASTAATPFAGSSEGVVPAILVPLWPARFDIEVDKQYHSHNSSHNSNHNAYNLSCGQPKRIP